MNVIKSLTPTRREWRRWSKPTRLSIVFGVLGFILAVIGNALGIIPLLSMPRETEPAQIRSDLPELFDPNDPERYVAMGFDAETIRQLGDLLNSRETLESARSMLLDLRRHSASRKATDFLNGLITSTWHKQGRHREGLEFLLGDATRGLPPHDYRYRYQFYWHIRSIARIEGNPEAERVIEELRRKYRRAELSRVWIAAPFAAVEALRRGDTPYDYAYDVDVDERERKYLERVLDEEPGDRFRDHALYFLRRYETVVEEHPNSLLRDAAMRTLVYDAFACVADGNCRIARGRKRLEQVSAEYPLLARRTAIKAAELLAASGHIADADDIACQGRSGCTDAREPVLRVVIDGGVTPAEEVIAWLAPKAPRLLEESLDEIVVRLDRTPALAQTGNYRGALKVYERSEKIMRLNGITPSALFEHRFETFRDLVATKNATDAQSWFTHGLALNDAAPWGGSIDFAQILRNNAADAFGQVEKLAPGSDLAAKACYLRAAALRRTLRFDESFAEIEHFLATYPGSSLFDDMLAEKGLYYRNILWDWERADPILAEVADRFPHGNAADNALTWMARTAESECRFADALALYDRIRTAYPRSRLGVNAQQEVRELTPIVRSRFHRRGIDGVTFQNYDPIYIAEVEPASSGAKSGLEDGMEILMVNETQVASVDAFYSVLSGFPVGRPVWLQVRRGSKITYHTAFVGKVERYATIPAGARCAR